MQLSFSTIIQWKYKSQHGVMGGNNNNDDGDGDVIQFHTALQKNAFI